MFLRDIARMTWGELRLACAAPSPAGGFTSSSVQVAGLRLHLRARRDPRAPAPAWVLLHGLAVSHRYLMPTAVALTGSVYVPDLPGFGLSGKPRDVYDPAQQAAAVAGWMEAAGIAGAYLLGNSFGCQIAVELAIRRPDLVAALVLVGPTVDPAAATATGQALRWMRDLAHEDPRQARILAADIRDAGVRRILGTLRHSVRHRMGERLALVGAPTLLLRGERDVIVSRQWLAQAGRAVAGSQSRTVPLAAHNAVTTAGRRVAAYANAFAGTLAER